MRISQLTSLIRQYEAEHAPGSETGLWGDYQEEIRREIGYLPTHVERGADEDREIPSWLAAEWLCRYAELDGGTDAQQLCRLLREPALVGADEDAVIRAYTTHTEESRHGLVRFTCNDGSRAVAVSHESACWAEGEPHQWGAVR